MVNFSWELLWEIGKVFMHDPVFAIQTLAKKVESSEVIINDSDHYQSSHFRFITIF